MSRKRLPKITFNEYLTALLGRLDAVLEKTGLSRAKFGEQVMQSDNGYKRLQSGHIQTRKLRAVESFIEKHERRP